MSITTNHTTNSQGVFTKTVGDTLIRVLLWEDAPFARWQAAVTIFDRAAQSMVSDRIYTVTPDELRYMRSATTDYADPLYKAKLAQAYWSLIA